MGEFQMKAMKVVTVLISSILIVCIVYFKIGNGHFFKERALYNLYKTTNTKQVDIDKVVHLLAGLDWQAYDSISDNGSFLLLSWLSEFNFEKNEHVSVIMKATKNLDGVASEQYSNLLFNIFEQNKYEFISSLALLNKKQYNTITGYLYYQFDYLEEIQKQKCINDLNSIIIPEGNEKFQSILNEITAKLENSK